jgi:hypothetical protein
MLRLSPSLIAQSRVIAKGKRIRDVRRLIRTYGGKASQWVKKSSPGFQVGSRQFEFHWYEHTGIGRVEVKRKEVQ